MASSKGRNVIRGVGATYRSQEQITRIKIYQTTRRRAGNLLFHRVESEKGYGYVESRGMDSTRQPTPRNRQSVGYLPSGVFLTRINGEDLIKKIVLYIVLE
ncbi:hypothetical protein DRQ36_01185 [bacterium]|nr:MAG: hypothetical protein DRQ36_01185 [bacterium]